MLLDIRHPFRTVFIIVCGTAVTASPAVAQLRGRALYDALARQRYVSMEGTSRLAWLPQGDTLLTGRLDSATHELVFMRIVPATGAEAPLVGSALRARITAALAKIGVHGAASQRLEDITYVRDGAALTFTVTDTDYLYDVARGTARRLLRPAIVPVDTAGLLRNSAGSQLAQGTWSPDYLRFAFVKGFDLAVANATTGRETMLTHGGTEDVMNARPDWVYPEELDQLDAFWWSPDGRQIAYLQFDERPVYQFPIVHETGPQAPLELQRYPVPGQPNPIVRLFVVNVETGRTTEIATQSTSDNYIVRPQWTPDSKWLLVQRLDRRQNVLDLLAANPQTGTVRTVIHEEEPDFINLHDGVQFLKDGHRFIWASERTGWNHLYLYDLAGSAITPLTSGDWPVEDLAGVDERGGWVYFSAKRGGGLQSQFFRARLDGSHLEQLTKEPGTHEIRLGPAMRYFVDTYSSLTAAPVTLLRRTDGTIVRTLARMNTARLDSLRLQPPEAVMVKAADGTTDLHGILFKPADFDSTRTYPLIVMVYGGPSVQLVEDRWQTLSQGQRLAQLGFLVWTVDNRGTPGRGKAFETATYLKLGQVDLADQAAAVKQLERARRYIDPARVGITGGSYGGYMTTMALLKEPDVFSVGVANSSPTDWRYYDTIYTERYMRTPAENTSGYDLGSALPYAGNLKGHLLLTYGTADNNVHSVNTIQLIQRLQEAHKQFDVMPFPDQRHGPRGAIARFAADLQVEYFLKYLKPDPQDEVGNQESRSKAKR
jgi:dipeptidyl-peptidase-4